LHQPHNPSHASTSGQTTGAKIPPRPSHPQTCGGPGWHRDHRGDGQFPGEPANG
jgi:hypothetical protein